MKSIVNSSGVVLESIFILGRHVNHSCLHAQIIMELNLCVDLYRLLVTAVYSVGTFQAGCLRGWLFERNREGEVGLLQ